MNIIKISTLVLAGSLVLSGCSTLKGWLGKRDNGSLDYQQSQKIDPIKLPSDQKTADFVQLYPTPAIKENTIVLTNEEGKQYQLPRPPKVSK